ncbi:MAG: hypothetical protein GF344_01390, partial [Chitinivibrionales bacterium]|nr:hypothetical protein [Chitinivibrionales bacterium]
MSLFTKAAAFGLTACAMIATAGLDPQGYELIRDVNVPPNAGTIVWEANDPLTGAPIYRALIEPVFIPEGTTLEIKPGCYIFGLSGGSEGDNSGTLCAAQGGKLIAEGTVDSPIVFTAVGDDPRLGKDMGPGVNNMWGGVILLGNAPISNGITDPAHPHYLEHPIEGLGDEDDRAWYGGDDPHDNSGSLKYVSIRHGGATEASNEEINGLTLGGVGDATVLDFIEVYANSDDGFEFFGGTVGLKHAVAAYVGDDAFDYDEGWKGRGQYWYAIRHQVEGERGGEHDGLAPGNPLHLASEPTIYNVTYVGPHYWDYEGFDTKQGVLFRDSAGGHYNNAIIAHFGGAPVENDPTGHDVWPRRQWGAANGLTFEYSI